MPNRQRALALGVAAVAVLGVAVPAQATEVTRASYKEAVEPICKANTQANEKILKGVRAEVKANKAEACSGQGPTRSNSR